MARFLFIATGEDRIWNFKKVFKKLDKTHPGKFSADFYLVSDLNKNIDKYEDMLKIIDESDFIFMYLHGGARQFNKFNEFWSEKACLKPIFYTTTALEEIPELMPKMGLDRNCYHRIDKYYKELNVDNLYSMILYISNTLFNTEYKFSEPIKQNSFGIYKHGKPLNAEEEKEFLQSYHDTDKSVIGIVFNTYYVFNENLSHIDALIEEVERYGAFAFPVYSRLGADHENKAGLLYTLEKYFSKGGEDRVDTFIICTGFSLTAMSNPGDGSSKLDNSLFTRWKVPVIQAMTTYYSYEEYNRLIQGLDTVSLPICVYQPEFDGQIITVPFATTERIIQESIERTIYAPIMDRVKKISEIAFKWALLRTKANSEKKVAIIFHNMPPRNDNIGTAHGLDSPESVYNVLNELKNMGISLEYDFKNSHEIIQKIIDGVTNDNKWLPYEVMSERAIDQIDVEDYTKWFNNIGVEAQNRILKAWGDMPGEIMQINNKLLIPGIINGNVFIGLQPTRATESKQDEFYHSTEFPPPHSYIAYYRWVEEVFKADIICHVGTHGTLEWLPGKQVGLSSSCYPDINIGAVPHIYIYNIGILGEGIQAKRRSYAVILDHLVPSMDESSTYEVLSEIDEALDEYYAIKQARPEQVEHIEDRIFNLCESASLTADLGITLNQYKEDPEKCINDIHTWVGEIKTSMVRDGLHVFGQAPQGILRDNLLRLLVRIKNGPIPSLNDSILEALGYEGEFIKDNPNFVFEDGETAIKKYDKAIVAAKEIFESLSVHGYDKKAVDDILHKLEFVGRVDALREVLNFVCEVVKEKIDLTTDELYFLRESINGNFVHPNLGGNPSRGNVEILPTGRNFYSIDPAMIPSRSAWKIGQDMAKQVLASYLEKENKYPESIAIIVYSGETMKTYGEDLAEILYLMGVRPVYMGNSSKVIGVEAMSLAELGRPRIDVTLRISGLFRDTFPNLIELVEKALLCVSNLDEAYEDNFIKKHIDSDIKELINSGISEAEAVDKASIRVFGCPPGTYGAGVSNVIHGRNWNDYKDLAEVYANWSSHGYNSKNHGTKLVNLFKKRLSTVSITIKNESSVEIDMLDSDDFYSYHGGLIACVRAASGEKPLSLISVTDDPDRVKTRDINKETARIMRSRILNPKWINGLKRHGYKGAQEISTTFDVFFGWDATSEVAEEWMYDEFANRFLFNKENRQWMESVNKWAVENLASRMLEAYQRQMWNPSKDTIKELRKIYMNVEGLIEEQYE